VYSALGHRPGDREDLASNFPVRPVEVHVSLPVESLIDPDVGLPRHFTDHQQVMYAERSAPASALVIRVLAEESGAVPHHPFCRYVLADVALDVSQSNRVSRNLLVDFHEVTSLLLRP